MAVPRTKVTPKALRTRALLFESALSLFKEKGFDATSMRDIATRADLSLGSTYYYFDSKEALVFEYYAKTQEAAARRNEETIGGTESFAERLRDLVEFKLEPTSSGMLAEIRSLRTGVMERSKT